MISNWLFYVAGIWFLYYKDLFGLDVNININMDYLPHNVIHLKIYNASLDVTNCSYLQNQTNFIYLKLDANLKSNVCKCGDVTFIIFTYYTNILSAIITVENKIDTSLELLKINKKIVILSYHNEYISFLICINDIPNCKYTNSDVRETLNGTNLIIYSACKEMNIQESCTTEIEFLSELNDFDSSSRLIGNKINIKRSKNERNYEVINCLNGGRIEVDNETKRKTCVCPKNIIFIDSGPRCEVTQQALYFTQYLYVLPNSNQLLIEFSLFSPGHIKTSEIFKIKSITNEIMMQYSIRDTIHDLKFMNQTIQIEYSLDKYDVWLNIIIHISKENLKLFINEKNHIISITDPNMVLMKLDTFPLIIRDETKISFGNKLCLSNLKINSMIIDLYTPNYEKCISEKCMCTINETCFSTPFKSEVNKCVCKPGYALNIDNICDKNSKMAGQIGSEYQSNFYIQPINYNYITFKLRTLLKNGTIFCIKDTSLREICIKLQNGLISAEIYFNKNIINAVKLDHYDVANGEWHTIQIEYKKYSLKITLDDKLPYNSNSSMNKEPSNLSEQMLASSFVFGPLNSINNNKLNLSLCIDTITLVSNILQNPKYYPLDLLGKLRGQCDSGIDCSSLNCSNNKRCFSGWQNSSCICEDSFTDQDGQCLFTKCINNPCQNKGSCNYDSKLKDYQCTCAQNYFGTNCESTVLGASFSWWIILIIILILLIILFIIILILLILRRKKKNMKRKTVPDINKIYENTIPYNIQAGETDYKGPPINFEILMKNENPQLKKVTENHDIHKDLLERKQYFDMNNKDLIIDYPLDYGYEGHDSDGASVSSFESITFNDNMNLKNIPFKRV